MIVGIDISRMSITTTPTGIERYSIETIPRVVTNLLDNTKVKEIWLYTQNNPNDLINKYPIFDHKKIRFKVLKMPFKLFWTLIRLTLHFLNPFTQKPDVFWVPSHILPLWIPFGIKSFQTMHDIAYRTFPDSYSWRSKLVLELGMLVARIHKTFFFYISNFTKEEVERAYKWPKNRGEVVHLGGDHLNKLSNTDKTSNENLILYVGRIEEKKGTKYLFKAFDLLKEKLKDTDFKDIKLIIVGKMGFGHEKSIAVYENMKYKDDVIIKGFTPDDELSKLYQTCQYVVFPSLYEGFGIPILEAFSYGKTVASSNRTSLPEVGGNACLYFDPFNIQEMVEDMYRLLNEPETRSKLESSGKNQLNKFSWDTCSNNIYKVLVQTP